MNVERIKILTEIITAWLGVLALIAGGIFAVYQYLQTEKTARVKETLGFLANFNEIPVFDARRKISMAWDRNDEIFTVALKKEPFIEREYDALILKYEKDEGLIEDVGIVLDFFDTLYVCVNKKICDVETAKLFFQAESCAFFHQHYARVMLERKKRNDPHFAKGIVNFCKKI